MISLAKKEFNAFFQSSTGVLIICAYLILNGLFLWLLEVPFNLIQSGYAQLDGLFMLSPWVFLFLIPAIGMKMLSDEKRTGTLEWLLTKPISEWQIIMGKYFAGMTLILFSLIPTFIYVITIFYFGNPKGNIDIGATIGSYIGVFLMASCYMSISLFTSAISENSIIAFVSAVLLCLFFYSGFDQIANLKDLEFSGLFWMSLGINEHYNSISRGVIDFSDITYFFVFSFIFLSSAQIILKYRNW